MARLDRQLDKLSGEKLVVVHWPEDDSVDIELLRAEMVREINSHSHRIPLDLRSVKGAPPELVDLLVDMQRYARSKSKMLSTTWILPPLREAIAEREGRRVGSSAKPSADPNGEPASKTAEQLLSRTEKKPKYDLSTAEKIERKKATSRTNGTRKYRYLRLGVIILVASLLITAVELVVLFQQDEKVLVPEKEFEH